MQFFANDVAEVHDDNSSIAGSPRKAVRTSRKQCSTD